MKSMEQRIETLERTVVLLQRQIKEVASPSGVVTCAWCRGTGRELVNGKPIPWRKCPVCGGVGKVRIK